MFEQGAEWAPIVGAPVEDDCFDPAWLDDVSRFDHVPELEETGQPPVSECSPSGWLALELDHGWTDTAGLSDADLIEGIIPSWDVDQHPDGRITWTTPTGHTDTSHPYDYRPDPHPPPGDDSPPF